MASGSHSDSIVRGGAYDGALGIIGAIAAVQAGCSCQWLQTDRSYLDAATVMHTE